MKRINTKVEHVRKAKQTRSHTCHWPKCKEQVPPAMWGCKEHWFKLPWILRQKIWQSYIIGQEEDPSKVSERYLEVARQVEKWIKENA